jgi:hypothetical protein
VFSERRDFATARRYGPDVIASENVFTALDSDGLLFGLVSSASFIAWQKTVGGRMKSDPRFSSTLVWNNLPLPALSGAGRDAIIAAGHSVIAAREAHTGQSLADLYDPLAMPKNLREAHVALDKAVDAAFGFRKKPTAEERLARLFALYATMSQGGPPATRNDVAPD